MTPHESITINDSDEQDATNSDEVIVFDVIKKPEAKRASSTSVKTEDDLLVQKKNNLLSSMYNWIIVRARTILTSNIKKIMNYSKDGCTETTKQSLDIVRHNTRKLKQMIQILESNINETNTHLNDIRNVTNDGNDLEYDNDTISVSSNEILDRLMILHKIE